MAGSRKQREGEPISGECSKILQTLGTLGMLPGMVGIKVVLTTFSNEYDGSRKRNAITTLKDRKDRAILPTLGGQVANAHVTNFGGQKKLKKTGSQDRTPHPSRKKKKTNTLALGVTWLPGCEEGHVRERHWGHGTHITQGWWTGGQPPHQPDQPGSGQQRTPRQTAISKCLSPKTRDEVNTAEK